MEKNKELVIQLLNTAFNEKNVTAAAELLTDNYIQHNPMVPTGKDGFLQSVPGLYKMFPDLKMEIKRLFADGDYVVAHSH
jgi:predicted SnoaL-like aldol condensation-catalyzing enzyme